MKRSEEGKAKENERLPLTRVSPRYCRPRHLPHLFQCRTCPSVSLPPWLSTLLVWSLFKLDLKFTLKHKFYTMYSIIHNYLAIESVLLVFLLLGGCLVLSEGNKNWRFCYLPSNWSAKADSSYPMQNTTFHSSNEKIMNL